MASPFVRSVMPALDRAFGLDRGPAFPEDIAALVARLRAGPLGRNPGLSGASADAPAARPAESIV